MGPRWPRRSLVGRRSTGAPAQCLVRPGAVTPGVFGDDLWSWPGGVLPDGVVGGTGATVVADVDRPGFDEAAKGAVAADALEEATAATWAGAGACPWPGP